MDVVIVGELRECEKFVPIVLPFIDKESEELFEFLIDSFCLSVGLWVVGGGRR